MIVLVGPSASGKTEVANKLIKKYNMKRIVTCTTRPMRVGEVNGIHYNFLSIDEFKDKINNNEFLEVTEYNNNFYGTLKTDVSNEKIIIVDINGLNTLVEKIPNDITTFYLEAPIDTRTKRMLNRGDEVNIIKQKNTYDKKAFKWDNIVRVDHIIKNYDITSDETADLIYSIYTNIEHNL